MAQDTVPEMGASFLCAIWLSMDLTPGSWQRTHPVKLTPTVPFAKESQHFLLQFDMYLNSKTHHPILNRPSTQKIPKLLPSFYLSSFWWLAYCHRHSKDLSCFRQQTLLTKYRSWNWHKYWGHRPQEYKDFPFHTSGRQQEVLPCTHLNENGELVKSDKKAAKGLNAFFALVFTGKISLPKQISKLKTSNSAITVSTVYVYIFRRTFLLQQNSHNILSWSSQCLIGTSAYLASTVHWKKVDKP